MLLCHLQPCTFRVKSCLSPSVLPYLKMPDHTWGQTHTSRECSSPSTPKVRKSPALNNQKSQSRSVFVAPRTSQQTNLWMQCLTNAVFPVFPHHLPSQLLTSSLLRCSWFHKLTWRVPDELHSKISLRIPREPASLPLPLHDTRSQPCVWCTRPHLPGPAAQPGDWVSPITSSLAPNPGSHTDPSRALPSGHQVTVPHKDQGVCWAGKGNHRAPFLHHAEQSPCGEGAQGSQESAERKVALLCTCKVYMGEDLSGHKSGFKN